MRLWFCLMCFIALSASANNEEAVDRVLNSLHANASEANFEAYFALYSDDAVFIGTDASETWDLQSFKNYAKPVFDRGTGWTYTLQDRHIYFSPGGDVAWFDELLDNASLGLTRGTGVLVKTEQGWKVSQYHLTIPIPNDIARDVAKQIKSHQALQ
ncbi:nuclear transport factor 2 family protein [Alteromonas gilva]|uniref:Nuclear transport factor 2 family protein n=1 Tax=Alteromonas gilva TaxID=2987522 RepID=A0ABT5KWM9_9ALTE|nr:nuclear transport factor 2 family protein [Alteromonas gilva]MDC8829188.1 nuclear transport factor 2 family protein [Alteromonas gilva]